MTLATRLHTAVFGPLDRADWLLPTIARLVFAGVLLIYFWVSALTKVGDGISGFFSLSVGAYAQIFPKAMEAVSYDITQMTAWHHAVAYAGTYAEFILPLLIVAGLLTRLAALGMIGFVIVQSLTDIVGHGADATTIGVWFDRFPGSLILDQRSLWVFLLLVLVVKGAGPLSFDRALALSRP